MHIDNFDANDIATLIAYVVQQIIDIRNDRRVNDHDDAIVANDCRVVYRLLLNRERVNIDDVNDVIDVLTSHVLLSIDNDVITFNDIITYNE